MYGMKKSGGKKSGSALSRNGHGGNKDGGKGGGKGGAKGGGYKTKMKGKGC